MHDSLHQLALDNNLSAKKTRTLWRLSGVHNEPQNVSKHLRWGLIILAALFLGAGLIFWVAANWDEQSRSFKLHLLQGAVATGVISSLFLSEQKHDLLRTVLLFFATLALGGLLAFIGITYQTGADSWELFALWAALALVWIAVGRSDWLWSVWLCILAAAIGLRSGSAIVSTWGDNVASWRDTRIWLDFALWLGVFILPILLSRIGAVRNNKSNIKLPISQRLAAFFALAAWTAQAIALLVGSDYISYFAYITCMLLVVICVVYFTERDILLLAMALLSANVLGFALLIDLLYEQKFLRSIEISFLLVSACAAMSIGASVYWLYQQQQKEK